jgi:DNA-binding response OmpR family regulator
MSKTPLIAIINDDPAFLEFIALFLEEETNYQTVVWDDGVDSLPKLRTYSPDLVILDVRLGDQAVGYEILEGMRKDPDLLETPVIVCTADTNFIRQHGPLIESLNADVLEKPFDLEHLEQKVERALSATGVAAGEADPVA